jgi:hypothetical protein
LIEIPICDPAGTPSGETVRVDDPPPEAWCLVSGSTLELRRFRELKRFGCGCFWEERLGYVAATARRSPRDTLSATAATSSGSNVSEP